MTNPPNAGGRPRGPGSLNPRSGGSQCVENGGCGESRTRVQDDINIPAFVALVHAQNHRVPGTFPRKPSTGKLHSGVSGYPPELSDLSDTSESGVGHPPSNRHPGALGPGDSPSYLRRGRCLLTQPSGRSRCCCWRLIAGLLWEPTHFATPDQPQTPCRNRFAPILRKITCPMIYPSGGRSYPPTTTSPPFRGSSLKHQT